MNQEELKQWLIELVGDCRYMEGYGIDLVEKQAIYLIANGVTIRERGEWEMQKYPLTQCSVCKILRDCEHEKGWNFCPHCGADMRGVKDE